MRSDQQVRSVPPQRAGYVPDPGYVRAHWTTVAALLVLLFVAMPLGVLSAQSPDAGPSLDGNQVSKTP